MLFCKALFALNGAWKLSEIAGAGGQVILISLSEQKKPDEKKPGSRGSGL